MKRKVLEERLDEFFDGSTYYFNEGVREAFFEKGREPLEQPGNQLVIVRYNLSHILAINRKKEPEIFRQGRFEVMDFDFSKGCRNKREFGDFLYDVVVQLFPVNSAGIITKPCSTISREAFHIIPDSVLFRTVDVSGFISEKDGEYTVKKFHASFRLNAYVNYIRTVTMD